MEPVKLRPVTPTPKSKPASSGQLIPKVVTATRSSLTYLSKPKKYKRYSDGGSVEAVLVKVGGKKLMEIREQASENLTCPGCRLTLSVMVGGATEWRTFLEVADFHKRHRSLDKD